MGYECPVCDAEAADGEHLANHLAFTALVRGGDHEAFLDDHVPDWEAMDPETLAPEVTPHATETDTEPVTEPQGHVQHDHDVPAGQRSTQPDLSGETAAILDDAVELTEAMHESSVANPDAVGGDDGDADEDAAGGDEGDAGDDTGGDAGGDTGGDADVDADEDAGGDADPGDVDDGEEPGAGASDGDQPDSENE